MAVADMSKALWLRAKDLTGATVTAWADQSGNGHNGTSSALGTAATADPTLVTGVTPSGGKAVKFGDIGRAATAADKAIILPDLGLTTTGEAWVVMRAFQGYITQETSPGLWSFAPRSSDATNFPYVSGNVLESFGMASRQQFTPTKDPLSVGWILYRVVSDAGVFKAWIDNDLNYTATGQTVAWSTAPVIGRSLAPVADYDTQMGGHIAEVLVRPVVSTAAEVADLITYFNAEHGLSVPGGSTGPSGVLNATGPAPTVMVSGSVAVSPVTGAVAATGPVPVVAATDALAPVDGVLGAVGPTPAVSIAGDVAGLSLAAWTKDESRKTRAVAVTSGVLDFTPPLELPPAGVVERPIMRESVIVPALKDIAGVIVDPLTGQPRVPDNVFATLPRIEEEVGVPHVLFSDLSAANDRTYWRGGQIRVLRDRCEEPFGDVSLTLDLPQVTSMDADADSAGNDSPLNWSRNRSNVEIVMRKSDGTTRRGVWTGHVVTHDGGNDERSSVKTLTCHGSLWQAASTLHRAPNLLDPTDVGTLVPKALNEVVSRRYPKVPTVTTGIMSRQRGTWSDSQMAFAQELLSTAQTNSGRQWTVVKVEGSRRTYEMRLKKDAPSWTVTNGAPGVSVSLSKDATVIRNVVYGHGVGPDGYAWWNYHYPNLRQDDAPAYPYSSAGTVMSVGSTDAGTSSGEGVSVWQRRARDLGYNVAVGGVFNDADATAARAIQRRYGLQVDGVVGPQTWAATFDVGGNGGDLSGAIRLPLAADPRTQRHIYNADGSIAGDNPAYDPNVIAYEADIDFGSGVTREQGIESAQQIVDRESEPALVGSITLKVDPREGSRFYIPPGDKITLLGYEGADPVLHIAARDRDWPSLTVTLEVDERARDAMTVQEIRDRNKAARRDPARRPGGTNRRSSLAVDQVVPFDGESGAGWIPRLALYGGLWTVIRVPVSELGRVARIDLDSSGPASKFAVALFGSPIQPAHLNANVGDPLASDDPFGPKAKLLEDRFGFIEGWGQRGQACGYGYGSEQDGSPMTGEFHDAGGFEYVSLRPPWIWVALYAASSTFIRGRILPAPIQ